MKEDPHLVELLMSDHIVNTDYCKTALRANTSGTRKNTNHGQPDKLLAFEHAESPLTSVIENWASRQQFLSLILCIFIFNLCVVIRTTLTVYSHVAMLLRVFLQENLARVSCCSNAISRLSRTRSLILFFSDSFSLFGTDMKTQTNSNILHSPSELRA